jgi:hypothetical protein
MANSKISALTSAAVLTGTEVLPIVQSGATVKVANNDLRPKQIQSSATSGILQLLGPGAGASRVMTTPNADFTVARTDAAQSFTGDQTLSTGNLIIGTSGKGIDFSATPGTGTSELFADYEEGTWTPAYSPATGAFTAITYGFRSGQYVKIGDMVYVSFRMRTSAITVGTASGIVSITGLPFTSGAITVEFAFGIGVDFAVNNARTGRLASATSRIELQQFANNQSILVTDLSTGAANNFTAGFVCYRVT